MNLELGLIVGLVVGLVIIGMKLEQIEADVKAVRRMLEAKEPPYED